jgi:putative transcriptional regulator
MAGGAVTPAARVGRSMPVDSIRGKLLIAGPTLGDPNFWRTVVLVVEHNEEGAMGLVLNRPSETTVGEAVPQLAELVDPGDDVLVGGPVQQSGVIVLAEFEDPAEAAMIAFEHVGIVGTTSEVIEHPAGVRAARAFAGHAGWGPGQLDDEVQRGDWIVEPARRNDAFAAEPAELWPDVLTRKGGSYALIARMPADPSLN